VSRSHSLAHKSNIEVWAHLEADRVSSAAWCRDRGQACNGVSPSVSLCLSLGLSLSLSPSLSFPLPISPLLSACPLLPPRFLSCPLSIPTRACIHSTQSLLLHAPLLAPFCASHRAPPPPNPLTSACVFDRAPCLPAFCAYPPAALGASGSRTMRRRQRSGYCSTRTCTSRPAGTSGSGTPPIPPSWRKSSKCKLCAWQGFCAHGLRVLGH
jgi:hypothetical protein